MPALHAVQKMLAAHSCPVRSTVDAGEFLEIEPDVFSVIISFNPTEAEHLARDLEEPCPTLARRPGGVLHCSETS